MLSALKRKGDEYRRELVAAEAGAYTRPLLSSN